jgi:sugar phosphate isomerase/epimerase
MVENGYEVQRVLDGSSVALCLDTGHLLTGGTDPAELAPQVPGRIAHAHRLGGSGPRRWRASSPTSASRSARAEPLTQPVGCHNMATVRLLLGARRSS